MSSITCVFAFLFFLAFHSINSNSTSLSIAQMLVIGWPETECMNCQTCMPLKLTNLIYTQYEQNGWFMLLAKQSSNHLITRLPSNSFRIRLRMNLKKKQHLNWNALESSILNVFREPWLCSNTRDSKTWTHKYWYIMIFGVESLQSLFNWIISQIKFECLVSFANTKDCTRKLY